MSIDEKINLIRKDGIIYINRNNLIRNMPMIEHIVFHTAKIVDDYNDYVVDQIIYGGSTFYDY